MNKRAGAINRDARKSLLEAGAISWDGSFDWPKRSDAINKTRPNDAPTLLLSPKSSRNDAPPPPLSPKPRPNDAPPLQLSPKPPPPHHFLRHKIVLSN